MYFRDIHERLADHIAAKVRNGEITERNLARRAGISQPHLHHVLKRKRYFSLQSADLVMSELGLSIYDLIRLGGDSGRDS
jgi:AraC-like DNA-binding protein